MLTAAERDGCHSHGLHRLEAFTIGCSTVNAKAVPAITTPRPATVVVDAGGGFQPLAQQVGSPVLEERARANGIAMMAVTNSAGMSGAMWYLAEELANAGLVSMVFSNTPAYLAPHGGKQRVYGTNPMAFGWPRDGHPPLVWDQASSAMARGEIELARQAGRKLQPGVGIGPDGEPSTDPATVLAGCQLPFGGFKGSNVAMMVELLGSALVGTHLAVDHPPEHPYDEIKRGLFVVAIDRIAFASIGANDADRMFSAVLESSEDARLPSQRRYVDNSLRFFRFSSPVAAETFQVLLIRSYIYKCDVYFSFLLWV
jgi:delta1-piperideine-2-carboxylate reductase